MIPHVTGHVTSPTVHETASHMPLHFDSPSAVSVSDNLGDGVHAEVAGDVDSCYGYFAAVMHKLAETACPHTYSLSLANQNASQGTPGACA